MRPPRKSQRRKPGKVSTKAKAPNTPRNQLGLNFEARARSIVGPEIVSVGDMAEALDREVEEKKKQKIDYGPQVRRIIKADIKASGLSRDEYVEQMNASGAESLKLRTFNNMVDDSHSTRPSTEFDIHHMRVTGSVALLRFFAEEVGYVVLSKADALFTKFGRLTRMEKEVRDERKSVEKLLGPVITDNADGDDGQA